MYQLWGHPVVLRSVDESGNVVKRMACPPDYKAPDPKMAPKI